MSLIAVYGMDGKRLKEVDGFIIAPVHRNAFDVIGVTHNGLDVMRVRHKLTGMTVDCKPGDDQRHAMQRIIDALTGG